MPQPNASLYLFVDCLLYLMQASILIPMAVVWWRRQHFSRPVKLLSWYVYLSLVSSVLADFFRYGTPPSNHLYLIGFNCGKLALIGAVYYLALPNVKLRRLIPVLVVAVLAGVLLVTQQDTNLAISASRIAQFTLLAACAILYLDKFLDRSTGVALSRDPLSLLSIGHLIFTAGTITAISLQYLALTKQEEYPQIIALSANGLVFNCFLTLAFLRARNSGVAAASQRGATAQLAGN